MGTAENDIFFGAFAEAKLSSLTDEQAMRFSALLDACDPDLFQWVTGATPVPEEHDTDVMRMLRAFTLDHAAR